MAQTSLSKNVSKLLLVGRTGAGISATGNSILGWSAFDTSGGAKAVTKDIQTEFSEIDGHIWQVIDMPGLENADNDDFHDKAKFLSNIHKALSACHGVINAVVLVYKYGDQFNQEMRECFESVMAIMGKEIMKNCGIFIMTNGKCWHKENGEDVQFREWCQKMNSNYGGIFEKCKFRCFLIENSGKENFAKQRKELRELVSSTSACTNENFFKAAATERNRFMANKMRLNFEKNPKELSKTDSLREKIEDTTDDESENEETPPNEKNMTDGEGETERRNKPKEVRTAACHGNDGDPQNAAVSPKKKSFLKKR